MNKHYHKHNIKSALSTWTDVSDIIHLCSACTDFQKKQISGISIVRFRFRNKKNAEESQLLDDLELTEEWNVGRAVTNEFDERSSNEPSQDALRRDDVDDRQDRWQDAHRGCQ